MYKTIIMPVDVFEMELSDKAVRHAEFLAGMTGYSSTSRTTRVSQPEPAPFCR